MTNADAAEVFQQFVDKESEAFQEQHNRYEIADCEDLMKYKKGSTVAPKLAESLGKSFKFYHGATEEQRYKNLLKGTHEERSVFLIEQNQCLMLRDVDWQYIFSTMKSDPATYARYYPMVRVNCDSTGVMQIVRAFVLNNELYAFAEELSKKYE